MVGLGSIKKNDKKIQYAPLLENIFFKHTAFISVPMFWSNGYCLFVYNNATIHHHYYYIFPFSETHLFRVLLTSDYLDIKGDQWKRRSLTEEDAFRELVHWCCCCCCAPRSWLCRSLHTTNISASWHPPCCCCVCAPLCTQCIAECSSSIFTPSFPPPPPSPPFPSTAAAMAAILHLLMPLEHNAAFLTHKLHSEGKWQNWMRHNLEGNNFLSTSSRKNAHTTGFWWRAFFVKVVLGY